MVENASLAKRECYVLQHCEAFSQPWTTRECMALIWDKGRSGQGPDRPSDGLGGLGQGPSSPSLGLG